MMLEVNVWFNYVASKANIADLPSRYAIEEMAEAILRNTCQESEPIAAVLLTDGWCPNLTNCRLSVGIHDPTHKI